MNDIITFKCRKCKAKIRTIVDNIGKNGRCPECKAINVIPNQDEILLDEVRGLLAQRSEDSLQI